MVSHLRPFWQLHQTRVGPAFHPERSDGDSIDVPNRFLDALCSSNGHLIPDEVAAAAQPFIDEAERLRAFCWEIAFPEVFFNEDGARREPIRGPVGPAYAARTSGNAAYQFPARSTLRNVRRRRDRMIVPPITRSSIMASTPHSDSTGIELLRMP